MKVKIKLFCCVDVDSYPFLYKNSISYAANNYKVRATLSKSAAFELASHEQVMTSSLIIVEMGSRDRTITMITIPETAKQQE